MHLLTCLLSDENAPFIAAWSSLLPAEKIEAHALHLFAELPPSLRLLC